ncbi:multidrug effflux MFS transporter [Mongoliimonas terrestris]|uniref:multidrug effflux MFS transporter n=1 Tax=Mongoliimonas terrestris TaxID=1709001 RepID=UPI000949588C|nr:multidrug effflux MFS transporter [Mongoliimonas terrestris]
MTAQPHVSQTTILSERATSAFGAMLVAIGPISMALYTPAMPTLVTAFGTTMAMVKATLTAYFAGFALAQLVCGPLSDGYGRKPVVLGFLALYVAASLVALVAPTAEWLIAARFVQGVGAAAGVAISRAIVRDSFTGQQSARIMNTIGIWLAVGPALSPTIGGILLQVFDWHAIFVSMVVYGVVLLAVVAVGLPETNRTPDPARARPAGLVSAYRMLLADRRFLRPSLVVGLTIGGLYALGTMLPFVIIERVGLSPTAFGLGMLMQSGSFIAGGIVTRRLLKRMDAGRLVIPGLVLCATGGVMLFASLSLLPPSFLGIMGPVGVFAFALALFMPAMTTEGLAPFPQAAGAAAALMGFLQMGGGFAGSAIATLFADPVLALATIVPAMTVIGLGLALALRKA